MWNEFSICLHNFTDWNWKTPFAELLRPCSAWICKKTKLHVFRLSTTIGLSNFDCPSWQSFLICLNYSFESNTHPLLLIWFFWYTRELFIDILLMLSSRLKDISTPEFSIPRFNPKPFNPRLFNHEFLNDGVEKSGVFPGLKYHLSIRSKVSILNFSTPDFSTLNTSTPWFKNSWLKNPGSKSSWLKSLWLKSPRLKLGVEKSGIEMSFNPLGSLTLS